MSNKKDRAFTVRFTEEQFHHIAEQADRAMMSPSNYIRAAAVRGKVNVILDGKAVARELKAIGNNLNQLTVLANMGHISTINLKQTHEDLSKLYNAFFALASKEARPIGTVNFIRYQKQSTTALSKVAAYISQEQKTQDDFPGQKFVSEINCSPQFAAREFRATRAAYHKDNPVWFYHYTQSFSPDESITGEQAHKLAMEFAEKSWPDSQILVATHIDMEHIHSHFLVNSVCYESGHMLRQGPTTLTKLRRLSDEICLAHGFSVLPPDPPKHSKQLSAREYRSMEKGQSWKMQLMIAIEDAMALARSRERFIKRLERKGYKVKWTNERKSITYTTPSGMKCRDIKLYESKFLKEMMENEFKLRAEIIGRIEGAVPQAGENSGRGSPLA